MPFYIYLIILLAVAVGVYIIQNYFEQRNVRIAEMLVRLMPKSGIAKLSYNHWGAGSSMTVKRALGVASQRTLVIETGVQNVAPIAVQGSAMPDHPTTESVEGFTIYRPPENLSDAHVVGIGIPAHVPMFHGRAPHPVLAKTVPITPLLAPADGHFYPARINVATNLPVDPRKGKNATLFRNLYFSDFLAPNDIVGILVTEKPKQAQVVTCEQYGFIASFGCLTGTFVRQGANLMLLSGVGETIVLRAQSVGILAQPKDVPAPPPGTPLAGDTHLATVHALGGLEYEKITTPFPCRVLRQYVDFGSRVEFNKELFLLERL